VAWRLDLRLAAVRTSVAPPAVVLRSRANDGAAVLPELPPAGFRLLARAPGWEALARCQTRG
jgi:hypothetical protein